MSITTNIALYQGFANSVNNGSITDYMGQASFAGNYLRQIFDNKEGFAYGTMGKTGSILLNMIDSDKAGFKREFNEARYVNTYLDPEIEYASNDANASKISRRRNVTTTSQIGQGNVSYRTDLDLAANLPSFQDNFVLTSTMPVNNQSVARLIKESELQNRDIQMIFNIVARAYEDMTVDYARNVDRAILQCLTANFQVVDGTTGQANGANQSISSLSSSSRIVNSSQIDSLWNATFEQGLITNRLGLDFAGLRRLSLTLSNFEFRGVKPVLLLPNNYVQNLFADPNVMNQYGFQKIANALLDDRIYIPVSEGHMFYKMDALPFDIIGFNAYYDQHFFGTIEISTIPYKTCKGILLSPRTFEVGYFNDAITKKYGDMISERRYLSTTQAMENLFMQRFAQFELMLKNPFLSKTITLGVANS